MSTKKAAVMTVVEKVLANIKGGDEAKVRKFFANQEKKYNRNIKDLQSNLAVEKSSYERCKERLQDDLEDAQAVLEDAFLNVTAEDVATNDRIHSFGDVYWDCISDAETSVEAIESKIEQLDDAFKTGGFVNVEGNAVEFDGKKAINEQIAKYKSRIEKLK